MYLGSTKRFTSWVIAGVTASGLAMAEDNAIQAPDVMPTALVLGADDAPQGILLGGKLIEPTASDVVMPDTDTASIGEELEDGDGDGDGIIIASHAMAQHDAPPMTLVDALTRAEVFGYHEPLLNALNALPSCTDEIATYYGIPVDILASVRWQESRSRGMDVGRVCGNNRNGTCDIGAMQINTWWLDEGHLDPFGISENDLLENECTNLAVGAWVLHQNYDAYGEWDAALAAYNAGSPTSPVGRDYATSVLSRLGDRIP